MRDAREQHGVVGSLFAPPATSLTRTLIRLSLHAGLSDPQVERIISVCQAVATTEPAPARNGSAAGS